MVQRNTYIVAKSLSLGDMIVNFVNNTIDVVVTNPLHYGRFIEFDVINNLGLVIERTIDSEFTIELICGLE